MKIWILCMSDKIAYLEYVVGKVFIAIQCVGKFNSQDGTPPRMAPTGAEMRRSIS
jgi:hypothetical protein